MTADNGYSLPRTRKKVIPGVFLELEDLNPATAPIIADPAKPVCATAHNSAEIR